jgi:hypothetical protein
MATVTTYVDLDNGNDANGGTSLVDAWLTLEHASNDQDYSDGTTGDDVTIKVVPLAGGARYEATSGNRFITQTAGKHAGVNWTIEPADGEGDIMLEGLYPFLFANFAPAGSITINNVDYNGTQGLVIQTNAANADVTINDCTLVSSSASHAAVLLNNTLTTAPYPDIAVNDSTMTDFTILFEGRLAGAVSFDGCTVVNLGGHATKEPFYIKTLTSLSITGSQITGTAVRNNFWMVNLDDFSCGSVAIEDSIIDYSAGDGTTNGGILRMELIGAGKASTTVSIKNNILTSNSQQSVVVLGNTDATIGETRATQLAATPQYGDTYILDNQMFGQDAAGGALFLGVGFNDNTTEVARNWMEGGSAAHVFYLAGNYIHAHDNYSTGLLTALLFGDFLNFHNNTCIASGSAGLMGATSGAGVGDWEASVSCTVKNNIFYTSDVNFAFSDYAYNRSDDTPVGYTPAGTINHDIDYNIYFAPNAAQHVRLSKPQLECTTIAQVINVWRTNTLDGSGGTAWGHASIATTNDVHSSMSFDIDGIIPKPGGSADVGKGDITRRPGCGYLDVFGRSKLRPYADCIGAVYPQGNAVQNILKPLVQYGGEIAA